MEFEEGNRIIANFMDAEVLTYHSSWDSLMPVLSKLNGGYKHFAMLWYDITKALIDIDILKTWEAVIIYIQWFYPEPKLSK